MGRIIISFSEDMFDIYLMGNGLFFRNWKKNSVKFITNQMQMNKMNFHLPVQQWQRRFAGVRYISVCYWLSWHSMWLMQVLHYKPQTVVCSHWNMDLKDYCCSWWDLFDSFLLVHFFFFFFFFPKQMMGTNVAAPEQKDWKIWTLFLAQSYNVLFPKTMLIFVCSFVCFSLSGKT